MGKATFEISLDNEVVEAGSHLKGALFAEVQQEITGTQMTIKFLGSEETKVRYTVTVGSDNNRHTESRYAYGSRNIVSSLLPVDSSGFLQGRTVMPGHYKIPLAVELPSELPSTMSHYGDGGHCLIQYKIEATLEGSGILWNYNCARGVTVRSKPVDAAPLPFNQEPYTKQVNFCCCFGRGFIAFGAMVDDTRLGRGETLTVNMSLRNHTTAQIQRTQAILTQYTVWCAGGHRSSDSQELVRVDFERFKGFDLEDKQRSVAVQQDLDDIFREMKQGVHAKSIQVPINAKNSFKGSLMEISHNLCIVAVMAGCCYDTPTITIPLQVGESASAASPTVILPTPPPPAFPSNFSADTTTVASTIRIPSSHALVGGLSVENQTEGEVAASPPSVADKELTPNLSNLLKAMKESIDCLSSIESKASQPSWRPVFESLQPGDYREIINHVDSDFEEAQVAEAVAQHVGRNFTCAYVVAALDVVSDWNRTNIVERLLPFCTDFKAN